MHWSDPRTWEVQPGSSLRHNQFYRFHSITDDVPLAVTSVSIEPGHSGAVARTAEYNM